jgi:hypothetical protein
LARVLCHIPDKGEVTQRYHGWYANRPRGTRRREAERVATEAASSEAASTAVGVVPAVPLALRETRRRWADLLRLVFEVDPLVCVRCGGAMRVVAIVIARETIDEILAHVRARSPPGRGPGAPFPRPARAPAPIAPAA